MGLEDIIKDKHSGDDKHLEFIFSEEKKIIVTAPAGCGKTTAMVSKIAWELGKGNISSNKKVLAMTFSVNAAMKIKDSLKSLLPELVENSEQYVSKVDVANYHNFAMKLLYKYGYSINQEFIHLGDFIIVDEENAVLNNHITSSDSDRLKALDDALKASDEEEMRNVIDDYWNVLNTKLIPNHIITYNGLLVSAIRLLRKRQVSSFYKEYYKMVIIDEFQDTNMLGCWLVNKLIGDNTVIFLGDDIQKIYGFLGAINGIFEKYKEKYPIKEIKFCNNYRFRTNESMKELDRLIRSYGNSYAPSEFTASINLKQLSNDTEEDNFIVEGIEKIIGNSNDKVAVLVRAGNQGESIAVKLKRKGILYFNALFKDTDVEFLKFYEIAIDEFHNATCDSGKALQRDLQSCLEAVSQRQNEIYADYKRKFVYDAMYKLLEVLFEESNKWEGTSKDRYENIDFILGSKGLKHMMEYIEEKVVLTTIHASKGLEWEYVIIPRMNAYAFPSGYMCGPCRNDYSCNNGFDYCQFSFGSSMEKAFKEEISVFYVAITRAKKNVFLTVNTGLNQWGYAKQKSCLVELQGLSLVDYTWEDIIL